MKHNFFQRNKKILNVLQMEHFEKLPFSSGGRSKTNKTNKLILLNTDSIYFAFYYDIDKIHTTKRK